MDLLGVKEAQVTTADYVDILSLHLPPGVTKVSVCIRELNVASVHYKIVAGMDGTTFPYEVTAEADLAQNATAYTTPTDNSKLSDPMLYLAVQVKDDGGHGSVSCWVVGS